MEPRMKKRTASLALVALAAAALAVTPACNTNTQGDDSSPVFLSVSFDLLPAAKNVGDGTLLQFSNTTLKSVLKSPGSGATQFLDTRVDDYVIEWSRIDGGKTAPSTEVFAGNVIVPAGGTSNLNNYPYMSPSALMRPPLDQLQPYNGGVDRETGRSEIRCAGKVTFRGHTLSGQPVTGFGTFSMLFYYSPPAAPGAVPARKG